MARQICSLSECGNISTPEYHPPMSWMTGASHAMIAPSNPAVHAAQAEAYTRKLRFHGHRDDVREARALANYKAGHTLSYEQVRLPGVDKGGIV